MQSADQILEDAARDGTIDVSQWPRVLENVLKRLHDIVHNDFPTPTIPLAEPLAAALDPDVVASTPPLNASEADARTETETTTGEPNSTGEQIFSSEGLSSSAKENEVPPGTGTNPASGSQTPIFRTPFGYELTAASKETTPSVRTDSLTALPAPPPGSTTLPPDLLSLYRSSWRTLSTDFAAGPPYTIQRLAELVVRPRAHYRHLPAYLRALDRVVSVSSPVTDFPLPITPHNNAGGFLTNGDVPTNNRTPNGTDRDAGLGSDESLGGALLTPIPWLRNAANVLAPQQQDTSSSMSSLQHESSETIDGPHGAGRIETVSVIPGAANGTVVSSNGNSSYHGGQLQNYSNPTSPPVTSPTLSEQSDASTSGAGLGDDDRSGPSSPLEHTTGASLREQGGLTQGELLRREQEAGIVPIAPSTLLSSNAATSVGVESSTWNGYVDAQNPSIELETPHARGPDEIGVADTGPQAPSHPPGDGEPGGLNIDAAVGRARSRSPGPTSPGPASAGDGGASSEGAADEDDAMDAESGEAATEQLQVEVAAAATDADGDVVVGDAEPSQGGGSNAS